jgi:hypothetical protein
VAFDIGHKHGGREFVAHHVALQAGHVHAVRREAAQRLVQRGRDVADAEHKAGDRRSGQFVPGRQRRFAGQDHKTGGVGRIILNPGGQHFEAVDLRRQRGSEGELARIVPLGHFAGGPGGVAGDDRLEAVLADQLPALAQGVDVAVDFGGVLDGAARDAQQVEVDGQEELAHDLQVGLGQQDVDVRHPPGNRVLDGDHGQVRLAAGHEFERVLKAGAGHTFHVREHLLARDIGVGAGLTLVRNLGGHDPYGFTSRRPLRKRALAMLRRSDAQPEVLPWEERDAVVQLQGGFGEKVDGGG